MDRIYVKHNEQQVAVTVLHADSNGKVYGNAEYTETIDTATLKALYFSGLTICSANVGFATPVCYGEEEGVGAVVVINIAGGEFVPTKLTASA